MAFRSVFVTPIALEEFNRGRSSGPPRSGKHAAHQQPPLELRMEALSSDGLMGLLHADFLKATSQ